MLIDLGTVGFQLITTELILSVDDWKIDGVLGFFGHVTTIALDASLCPIILFVKATNSNLYDWPNIFQNI